MWSKILVQVHRTDSACFEMHQMYEMFQVWAGGSGVISDNIKALLYNWQLASLDEW